MCRAVVHHGRVPKTELLRFQGGELPFVALEDLSRVTGELLRRFATSVFTLSQPRPDGLHGLRPYPIPTDNYVTLTKFTL